MAHLVKSIALMSVCSHSNLVFAESDNINSTQVQLPKDRPNSAVKGKAEQIPQANRIEIVKPLSPQKKSQSAESRKGIKKLEKTEKLKVEDSLDAQTVLDLDEVPSIHTDLCNIVLPSGRPIRNENHPCPSPTPKVK